MSSIDAIRQWRDWFPIPRRGGRISPVRWVLLEGKRHAVTGALLTFVFVSFMLIGELYTFEMAKLLTETQAVQTVLNTILGGIILLVSVVVSINSIVLSHDMTSVDDQEARLEATMAFRQEIGQLTEDGADPTDPASFLDLMGDLIEERAAALEETVDGHEAEYARQIDAYAGMVDEAAERVENSITSGASGAEFGVLWLGLEVDYGEYLNRSRAIRTSYGDDIDDEVRARLEDLGEAFQLFATGREYFKTLYYSQEVAGLSRTLLVVSLPAIIATASAILAINAQLLPEFWLFGLPPLLTVVAVVFTISLSPYIILTSYTLRLSTVAKRTTTAGPFSLSS